MRYSRLCRKRQRQRNNYRDVYKRQVVYLAVYYNAEKNVAVKLAQLCESELKGVNTDMNSLIALTERETGITLSEKQKYAVITSLSYGVSVITGGPGTGKTTIRCV